MKHKCSDSKCQNKDKNKQIFDTGILNEMFGRDVCKIGLGLCKDCIKFYYGISYEEIRRLKK